MNLKVRERIVIRALLVLALSVGVLWADGAGHAAHAEPLGFKVELFVEGGTGKLVRPVDLAWEEGTNRMFVSEEDAGRIRIINNGRLLNRPCVELDVATHYDRGLTGLVLDPAFEENHYLYAYYTADTEPRENRISRFTVEAGRCTDETEILWGLGSGIVHQGGQMVFDDEGYLFVTTGENNVEEKAQDLDNLMGKVLRLGPSPLTPEDVIPETNPFPLEEAEPRNAIWSYGHRNGFGLAWVGPHNALVETENGPMCDDEVNEILEGQNYGWGPLYECGTDGQVGVGGQAPTPPLFTWESTVAPTDAWWYQGRLDALSDALYVGDFNGSQLHRFDWPIEPSDEDDVIYNFQTPEHRIISVSKGPKGWLYLVGRQNVYRLVTGDSEKVGVDDDFFTPKTANIGVGGFVRWTRVDPASDREHNIQQREGLFRLPDTESPIELTETFSAGGFPYRCTLHFSMNGVVRVPPVIQDGPAGQPFTVRWATSNTTTGNVFDVDYRVNQGNWQHWKKDASGFGAVFGKNQNPIDLDAGKDYSFRVRSGQGRRNSSWSPVATQEL